MYNICKYETSVEYLICFDGWMLCVWYICFLFPLLFVWMMHDRFRRESSLYRSMKTLPNPTPPYVHLFLHSPYLFDVYFGASSRSLFLSIDMRYIFSLRRPFVIDIGAMGWGRRFPSLFIYLRSFFSFFFFFIIFILFVFFSFCRRVNFGGLGETFPKYDIPQMTLLSRFCATHNECSVCWAYVASGFQKAPGRPRSSRLQRNDENNNNRQINQDE